MAFVKIWIHVVWSTKNREPFLKEEIRQKVFVHIRENAKDKGIYIDFIKGHIDHVYCLTSLVVNQNLAKLMQLLKGESAFWINKSNLCTSKFEWQDEYFVVSVSESVVDKVQDYIKNQERHHQLKTFAEEQEDFKRICGFKKLG